MDLTHNSSLYKVVDALYQQRKKQFYTQQELSQQPGPKYIPGVPTL